MEEEYGDIDLPVVNDFDVVAEIAQSELRELEALRAAVRSQQGGVHGHSTEEEAEASGGNETCVSVSLCAQEDRVRLDLHCVSVRLCRRLRFRLEPSTVEKTHKLSQSTISYYPVARC